MNKQNNDYIQYNKSKNQISKNKKKSKLMMLYYKVSLMFSTSFWQRLAFFIHIKLPLQFPFVTLPQTLFITRNAWVFLQNSWTFGLSQVFPLCLWQPKNFSKGSCDNRSLRKHVTPGMVNRYLTSSTNDFTEI